MAEQVADPELRRGFDAELEAQMNRLISTLDELIDLHDRCGIDTIQRTYLYKARHALLDGAKWFEWQRSKRA